VLVLAIGQAGERSKLSLERIAINLDDARITDNAGAQPIDTIIIGNGAPAYFSSLPIKAMLAALHESGIPAEISQTAGTYVCNHVFYGLMHTIADRPDIRGGFLHIPYLPEHALQHSGAPSLPLAVAIEGVRLALRAALSND
jgi:pyroglutamyl-peptidase